MKPVRESTVFLAFVMLVGLVLAGCTGAEPLSIPHVWIDVPTEGLRVPVDQQVRIEGRAAYRGGIARVEILVNGGRLLSEENPPAEGNLVHFDQLWTPSGAGDYTVEVVAVGTDGTASEPDSVRLTVGEVVAEVTPVAAATATPLPTATPVATPVPTPVPTLPPGAVIQFWGDAEQVAAGSCTTVRWHVENVQAVFFDGAGVAGDGTYQACPCADETHTLTVNLTDGSQEQRMVTVQVSGACAPVDNDPPPAPTLLKPLNNQTLPCAAKVMLRWNAVSDPSGIAEYRVQVERHAGDNNWQAVSGSPWTGVSATELEINVQCGWYYRWKVQAVDGAGNPGPFPAWFKFTVPLT